jgi:hypothetical protein
MQGLGLPGPVLQTGLLPLSPHHSQALGQEQTKSSKVNVDLADQLDNEAFYLPLKHTNQKVRSL